MPILTITFLGKSWKHECSWMDWQHHLTNELNKVLSYLLDFFILYYFIYVLFSVKFLFPQVGNHIYKR